MNKDRLDEALSRLYDAPRPPESFETGWRGRVRREEIIQMKNRFNIQKWTKTLLPIAASLVLVVCAVFAMNDVPGASHSADSDTGAVFYAAENSDYAARKGISASADYGVALTSGSSAPPVGPQDQEGRKLVRTADLSIAVPDFEKTMSDVKQLLESMGGYIESMHQYGEDEQRANLQLRVPSEKMDEFLNSAGALGRVTSRSESCVDMTTQYTDNQARLNTLYAKRDRLNELMAQAVSVDDLIIIESSIADTQYQIDSYETSQRTIDRQVDMSAVSLSISQQRPAAVAIADVKLSERMRAAFTASVEWLGDFLRGLAVAIAMLLPIALPLALLCLIIYWLRRRQCRTTPAAEPHHSAKRAGRHD